MSIYGVKSPFDWPLGPSECVGNSHNRHNRSNVDLTPSYFDPFLLKNTPDHEQTDSPGERVTEKLSISVPTQPLQRPTGVLAYTGQRVRLYLRDGSVIVALELR